MDATTTPSTLPLLNTLARDYPFITFQAGEQFEWHPHEATVVYDYTDPSFEARLLHEVGHCLLSHKQYDRDIDLVAMERDAWQEARTILGPKYGIVIHSDAIDADMDTYRDWLHSRSTCPHCDSTGIQTGKKCYTCVTCRKKWQVNEARACALRRYKK
jgi:hypothetical protein